MNKALVIIFAILVVTGVGVLFFNQPQIAPPLSEPTEHPLIRVETPRLGDTIKSPLTIRGEASGGWFFEASFPIRLLDASGNEIPLSPPYIMTAADWMTTEFVPFESTHTFPAPTTETGTLILIKDNPSGLPEFNDQIEIPVQFEKTETPTGEEPLVGGKPCFRTGCSGQVCSLKEVITTCEFLPQYACYWTAACERQADGECGFTQTPELISCLLQNQ
ncbi:MAG TPA: Gmad2 immunoglobulin-like domain-containing protein [Candidatus Paceibacterota bacterium]|nr:Gmad2 immunoglobulin-like domain-containing protein [Candidatus Paceibacterota bacterium]